MKKRILSFLIALSLALSLCLPGLALPAAAASGSGGSGASNSTRLPTPTSGEKTVDNGFTVKGDPAGYTYENGVLTVKHGAVLEIKNTNSGTTTHHIVVQKNANAHIILAGVNIEAATGICPLEIEADSAGDVTIALADGTTNTLMSKDFRAGLEKAGGTTSGTLTIRCAHDDSPMWSSIAESW